MAYSTSNPPICVAGGVGNGPQLWMYNSEDVHTDVDATGYFTNGHALGLRVGDVMIVSKTTATVGTTIHYVSAVTVNGAATVALAILA
jgi:hypothetical protein